MLKKVIALFSIISSFMTVPVFAQGQGDLNCNGFMDVADLVRFLHFLNLPCTFQLDNDCVRQNSDTDLDGRPMTIGDIIIAPSFMFPNGPQPPFLPQHPDQDTIMVESAIARPGDNLVLPLWLITVDTVFAFQFLLEVDTNYVEFDTIIVYYELPLKQFICDGNIYGSANHPYFYHHLLLPGDFHIADIIVNIKLENDQPVTTYLSFSSDPPRALYTGFANSSFFQPVIVDAEIEIIP